MEDIYVKAQKVWRSLDAFRSERARCKRYVYGEQWDDPINLGSHSISEREFILSQGQVPLKNNILRRILRNVIGLYRSQYKVPQLAAKDSGLTAGDVRAENRRRRRWFHENRMEQLAPRLLEEFLISGLVAVKLSGSKILPVTPDNFLFHSDGYDPRGCDIDMVGEVHRVGLSSLMSKFCHTADDYRRLSALYRDARSADGSYTVTEVWHKDTQVYGMLHDEHSASIHISPIEDMLTSMPKEGSGSIAAGHVKSFIKTVWRRQWFAHDGTMLCEGEEHDRHPYVFKAYPFIDGEVHSYISDLIDQQRYVNRLITLYDFIMKSSAKGVLLFPDESIPAGMDLQDVANEWSRFNGVIPYRAKAGVPMPTQVSGNAANIGITELLKIEMQMLEDISGVSPTLQGKLVTNSTSGTLFAQQNAAAQTSLLDVLRTFTDFLESL
ncbi:MAG: hypothetical protein K2H60_00145 [Muribaculaceae bacterium]|nr:hypothetical protein [Muribaculaceae bacterium]